uniref:F-box domain-containing protein n=1 Tax=Kalanchoe fedtschenkoi TaxID=63787 RepID=A0A7N0UZ16_KALFE
MSAAADEPAPTITAVLHPDIIHTQILTRLDGPTLASASCASAHLHQLTSDEHLWRNISIATWPSITHPKIQSLISSFPHRHRSLYSDSFPLLTTRLLTERTAPAIDRMLELVSAVDLFYEGKPILTRVVESECDSGWFHGSPFRIDMLESKEAVTVPTIAHPGSDEAFKNDLERNLTLSWILIDPSRRKSANLSSSRPVFVRRRWTTGDVQVRFATVLRMDEDTEIQCRITVACGLKEGGDEVDVREMSMHLEDMDGKNLCGEYGLAVLAAAVEFGERRKGRDGEEKERYDAYLERRRERRSVKDRRERLLDLVFIGVSVSVFVSFWGFVLFW